MILNPNQTKLLAREMGSFIKKFPGKPLSLEDVFQLAAATDVTHGAGGKRVLLKRAGMTRDGGGSEIRSLDDQEWRDVWCALTRLRSEGFVQVSGEPNVKFKYDPKEDRTLNMQVLTPEKAQEPLRDQLVEALVALVYETEHGFLPKDVAKKRICERFGYKDIKHTLWGPIVRRACSSGFNGRVIVKDDKEKVYMIPDLVQRADEVAVQAVAMQEPVEVIEKVRFAPSQVSIASDADGVTTVTLGDGTIIVRDPKNRTITVKTKESGWQVIVTNLLSFLF